jgi:hypothetical protein
MLSNILQLLRRPPEPSETVRAGFYRVGETPTLLEGAISPVATNAHEQTHRDTISNTFFGYVLLRMSDIADQPEASPEMGKLMEGLTRRAWSVFEGVATATEFLTLVAADPKVTLKHFNSQLPSDYRRAWEPFETLIAPHVRRKAHPRWPLLIIGLVHAVSECILDTGFYYRASKPVDFRGWLAIAEKTPFDLFTTEYLKMANYLDGEKIQALTPRAELQGPPVGVAFRNWVQGFKLALLEIAGSRLITDPLICTDSVRMTLIAEVERKLLAEMPNLPSRFFDKDRLAGYRVAYQIREKARILPYELLDLPSMEQRLSSYAIDGQVFRVVLAFVPESALGNRLTLLPILRKQRMLDDGRSAEELYCDHFLLAVAVTGEVLEDMSRRCQSGKIIWLSVVLPLQLKPEIDPLIVFIDPILKMEPQVYLYCTAFDSEWLRRVMNRIGTPVVLENTGFEGLPNRLVLRAVTGRFCLFWILLGLARRSDGSVELDGLRFESLGADEDDGFSAVVLATELGMGALHEEK